ncbi:hypothetical protein JCM8202_002558 [Rhodotorula sphaerocarpa]
MGAAPDSAQLSAQLRAAVKAYCGHSSSLAHAATTANRLHADAAHAQALEALADQLGEAYGTINTLTDEEIRRIDDAVALIDALEALYQAPLPGTPARGRPPTNKKRKTDSAASRAGSPSASSAASPVPTHAPAASPPANAPIPISRAPPHASAASARPSPGPGQGPAGAAPPPPPPPLPIAPAPVAKKPTAKSRRDALIAQLPLRPGRTIAVKESKKTTAPGPVSDNYILGRIVQCLQGDKNRYSVEDVDYDPANPTPEGGKWNTTLKSIIPLPEKGDERTYPDYEYPAGSFVLACYPETTSFYRATVESGPHVLTLGTGKKKETQKLYRLKFDDDDGQVRDVPLELICDPTPV